MKFAGNWMGEWEIALTLVGCDLLVTVHLKGGAHTLTTSATADRMLRHFPPRVCCAVNQAPPPPQTRSSSAAADSAGARSHADSHCQATSFIVAKSADQQAN